MKKALCCSLAVIVLLCSLCGCDSYGAKTNSMSVIYCITTILSLVLLLGYCTLLKKKDMWFITLFASVFIVNAGYLSLSLSQTLDEALLANRIAYLGSAVLPLSMLMVIKNTCNIKYSKSFITALISISIIVFLIAASPPYLDIYYKSVSLISVNGVSVLDKEYGSWHCIYLFYLLGYFITMIATITYAIIKGKVQTPLQAIILACAVLVNIAVWLMEQFVKIDFEILSVSYIVSELFLLALYLLVQESEKSEHFAPNNNKDTQNYHQTVPQETHNNSITTNSQSIEQSELDNVNSEKQEYLLKQLPTLTATEKNIYKMHLASMSTKEILAELNIKENTLKYHNRNIYSKLGVSSKKELREIASSIQNTNR